MTDQLAGDMTAEPTGARRFDTRKFWRKVRKHAAALPFATDLVAAFYCATDRATPSHVKAVLLGALAYFVMPADMIPDFIAGLGFTDDASVLAATIAMVRGHITDDHRERAYTALAGQPKPESN